MLSMKYGKCLLDLKLILIGQFQEPYLYMSILHEIMIKEKFLS